MKKHGILFLLAMSLAACNGKSGQAPAAPAPAAQPAAVTTSTGDILARVNGENITTDDVKKVSGSKLAQAEMELYDVRKDGIDQIIDDKILSAEATAQNVSKDDLMKKNVNDKIKVEDKEVEKFYNEKKDQMQGKKLDEVKPNIKSYLFREKFQKAYGEYVGGLRKKAKIEMLIKAPKVEVAEGEDNPSIGPKDAPVKIIEFTDYQCPFCGRARPTINQILDAYKGKVRYTLRDFPLSFHQDSVKAHEAAHCAGEQGKYWDLNHILFSNQQAIKVDDLKKYAGQIKLNQKKFDECLDSGKFTGKVNANQAYGETVGVSGTPAFFINGRMVSGARPFENFKSIIDDELRSAE